MNHCRQILSLGLLLASLSAATRAEPACAAESAPATAQLESTNSQEALRAYLQLQEQIHAAQLSIEQARRDADQAAAENAKALAERMQSLETALNAQRARELDVQSSNRIMLVVSGAFAAIGFIAMLLMAYFQNRAVNRLAEISAAMPSWRAIGLNEPAALGPGEGRLVTVGAADQSNLRLLGALERLEKRIYQLEHTARPPLQEGAPGGNGVETAPETEPSASNHSESIADKPSGPTLPEAGALLAQGLSLLESDDAPRALACFDEVLKIMPGHAEALVKKGTALERLRRLEEARQCYDQAIAADSSMTIAYLCKGGLLNRMERFSEALECYEKALRTQEGKGT